MRWIKLIAILSLWLFFFVVLALVHLWISVLRLPNRWRIASRWMRGFTWLMRRILNIKVTLVGDAGQLERGACVIISNHLGYLGLSGQPGLNLLLRRYGFWPPHFEASHVAAGRSQGDDPAEGRMFRI